MTYFYQFLFLIFTYLIAAIPFGLVLAKLFGKEDLRLSGSGNIGATNAARVLGKRFGLATLILDGLKGALMVILARYIFADAAHLSVFLCLVAAIAVAAHIFPVYINFKGGKGVATTLAVLLVLNPVIGLFAVMAWAIVFVFTRTSAIASLSAIIMTTGYCLYSRALTEQILLCIFLAVLIFIRHKENIDRLLKGEEHKFGKK
jgi:glycerol-3-phosphate acyltransferase PlsY